MINFLRSWMLSKYVHSSKRTKSRTINWKSNGNGILLIDCCCDRKVRIYWFEPVIAYVIDKKRRSETILRVLSKKLAFCLSRAIHSHFQRNIIKLPGQNACAIIGFCIVFENKANFSLISIDFICHLLHRMDVICINLFSVIYLASLFFHISFW